jgi:glycerophosphoryl diester phosphodiesterase
MKRPNVRGPLVLAHRGASRAAPENTLPAFAEAIRMGADGVELDVQYSSDGHLMVFHSPDLSASTDGKGRLTSLPVADLKALDAGAWFAPEFAGTRIATLDEALDLLAGKMLVNIEMKSLEITRSTMPRDVVEAVRAHNMVGQVVISSFNPFAVRQAGKAGPEIERALLLAPDLASWLRTDLVRRYSRAQALHPESPMIAAEYVARARGRGLPVRAWTVNDEGEMRRLVELGVDAIMTDVPDVLLSVLRAQNIR